MISNHGVETLNKIVRATISSQLDEYNSTQKFSLDNPTPPTWANNVEDHWVRRYKLEEYMNYFELDPVAEEDFEAEVLSKSLKAAREIAFTVDFQIRRQARKYGTQWRYDLKRLHAIELFKKADGTPNLKLNFVNSTSTIEMDAPIVGWIAYKFLFACG